MAPRGSKRAAPKAPAEEPGAKRVADFLKLHGISKASFAPVQESIQHPLAGLSEATSKMILAALPWSLAVPADQRHEVQQAVVRMTDEVLEAVVAKLDETLASETGKLEELEGSKATLEEAAQKAEAAAAEAASEVAAREAGRGEAQVAEAARGAAVQEAETAEQKVAAELEATKASVVRFEEVLATSFAKLKAASFEDGEADALVEQVMAAGRDCSLEDSLLATLPACLARRERGAFDQQVLEQAEQSLRQKVASLGEAKAASEGQLGTCQAAAGAAKGELEAATVAQSEVADQLRSAEEQRAAADTAAAEARRAVDEFQASVAEAQAAKEKSREAAEGFRSYNLFMFQMLRDATTQKASEPAAAEEQQQQQEADAAMEPAAEVPAAAAPAAQEPIVTSKIPEQAGAEVVQAVAMLGA